MIFAGEREVGRGKHGARRQIPIAIGTEDRRQKRNGSVCRICKSEPFLKRLEARSWKHGARSTKRQETEDRRLIPIAIGTEDRRQKRNGSVCRICKSEPFLKRLKARSWKHGARFRWLSEGKTEDRRRKTEDRRGKREARRWKTEDRRQKAEDGFR